MGAAKARGPYARRKAQPKTAAAPPTPAVHTDALWDNPGVLTNITAEPIDSRGMTKGEYFALLNRHGLRMKNQQESTTGPAQSPVPADIPLSLQPAPPPDPFTKDEARLFGAMEAFYRQYGIHEALYCQTCFTRKRHHGCRVNVTDRDVSVACRCGTASYRPPTGTTDLVIRRFTTAALTENDKTTAVVQTAIGAVLRPTVVLEPLVAGLLRQYFRMLARRHYEPQWYHAGCWDSGRLGEAEQVALQVADDDIAIVCRCRVLYFKRHAVIH